MTGSRPPAAALRTARRTSGSPSRSNRSLFLPMRIEDPAASTTPATLPDRSVGMHGALSRSEMTLIAARQQGEQLRHDAHRDLFRTVGAQVQSHRTEHAVVLLGTELAQHVVNARAGPENADVAVSYTHLRAH